MFGYLLCLIAWLIYLMSLLGSLITLLFLGFGDIRDTSSPLWLSLKAGVFPDANGNNSSSFITEQPG